MEGQRGIRIKFASGAPGPALPEPPMPNFSAAMKPFGFLFWIPAALTAAAVFIAVFFIQLAYNILTQPDAPITYGSLVPFFIVPLAAALITGIIVKMQGDGKFKRIPKPYDIPIQ